MIPFTDEISSNLDVMDHILVIFSLRHASVITFQSDVCSSWKHVLCVDYTFMMWLLNVYIHWNGNLII